MHCNIYRFLHTRKIVTERQHMHQEATKRTALRKIERTQRVILVLNYPLDEEVENGTGRKAYRFKLFVEDLDIKSLNKEIEMQAVQGLRACIYLPMQLPK